MSLLTYIQTGDRYGWLIEVTPVPMMVMMILVLLHLVIVVLLLPTNARCISIGDLYPVAIDQ